MTFREKSTNKFYAFALAAVFSLTLAGCGGGGGGTAEEPPAPMPPTPEEMCADAGNHWVDGACLTPSENTVRMALAAIAAAATAEDAQAAYDAVKDDVSAAQGEALQAAVDAREAELATMARVEAQKMALMTAAGDIDISDLSTQEAVDAARGAIVALRGALDAAEDVSDADKAMYMSQLDDAVAAVDEAQGGINTEMRRTNQMTALTSASGTLQAALAALSGQTPTQAQLDDANTARNALNDALAGAMDLTDTEKAPYQREADNAAAPIRMAQAAFDDATDEADEADKMAMMETAMKLHAGIKAPNATTGADQLSAAYGAGDNTNDIAVTIGTSPVVNLSEDEDATVAANHGWEGMRFTVSSDDDGTYEAYVYSDVGDPTEGAKFNDAANGGYALNADTGETVDVTTLTGHTTGRVASPSFDQSAGTKTFELPGNAVRVMIPGSYRGVSGTYYCAPTGGGTDCSAAKASSGFTLGGGTWTFKPTDPETRFMGTPDAEYASYGWWLHTAEDGTLTASAFADNKGADPTALAIADLQGTATYTGGAAGKYALYSATGGTNDAGHFTARATLNATFGETHEISGTIDNFMGADGESRDWSVTLNESTVSDTGGIAGDPAEDGNTDPQMTVWTIGGTAADAGGQWSGNLQAAGDDGVPSIGTGTFHSTYSTGGQMVGAFGVKKQ
ncbi:MAG: hypothetical protein OXQ29_17745 [Rhodospirillaceae bacterium]|nr:hypothetical protein [Rhodospirillaceae bacterium]